MLRSVLKLETLTNYTCIYEATRSGVMNLPFAAVRPGSHAGDELFLALFLLIIKNKISEFAVVTT
jgi:hypothetical protein